MTKYVLAGWLAGWDQGWDNIFFVRPICHNPRLGGKEGEVMIILYFFFIKLCKVTCTWCLHLHLRFCPNNPNTTCTQTIGSLNTPLLVLFRQRIKQAVMILGKKLSIPMSSVQPWCFQLVLTWRAWAAHYVPPASSRDYLPLHYTVHSTLYTVQSTI